MSTEPQAQVETDDTPYDLGYDPFQYDSREDYVKSVNALVDAINATREI
jgi:hypothetical protein